MAGPAALTYWATQDIQNTKYSQNSVQSSKYISIPRTDQKALLELQTDPTQLLVVVPILMGEVDLQRMSGGAIGFLDRISQVVTAAKLASRSSDDKK